MNRIKEVLEDKGISSSKDSSWSFIILVSPFICGDISDIKGSEILDKFTT